MLSQKEGISEPSSSGDGQQPRGLMNMWIFGCCYGLTRCQWSANRLTEHDKAGAVARWSIQLTAPSSGWARLDSLVSEVSVVFELLQANIRDCFHLLKSQQFLTTISYVAILVFTSLYYRSRA